MEHHAASIEDSLIGRLNFKLKEGASYGGDSYSSNGVKVIKFNITGDRWLSPESLRVHFQLNNESPDL
eukprot:15429854-Heterocapsa_arctica.AAC.1